MTLNTVYDTAYRGDLNQVKVKLSEDEELLKTADLNGRLLIHWASLGGNLTLVSYLLDAGSVLDPVDDTNCTPLILAASSDRIDVVKFLVSKGADIHHKTDRRQFPLLYACSKGHKEIAKVLIEAGAKVNDCDVLGATPLHRAAAQGRSDIVQMLLDSPDIKIDMVDSTGSTPLHLACEEEREAVASLLIKAGADVQLLNKEEKTPLDVCSAKLKKSLLQLVDFHK